MFSEEIFKVARVNAASGNKQTTYVLADLDDAEERGTWIRPQLLHIPAETLNYLSDDDMDDEMTMTTRMTRMITTTRHRGPEATNPDGTPFQAI